MQLFSHLKLKLRGNSKGTAITEFAISIPLLAILMIGTFETGRAFSQYMALTQIAYEGARAGSQLMLSPSNEGCFSMFVQDDMEATSTAIPANGPDNPHRQIMSRVTHLIGLQGDNVTLKCDSSRANNRCADTQYAHFATRPTIMAEYVPTAGFTNGNCSDNPNHASTYAIRIQGTYRGLLFPLQFRMSAESRALVLSSNQNFTPEFNGQGTEPEQKECTTEEIKAGKCPFTTDDCTKEQLIKGTCPYGSCTPEQIAKGACQATPIGSEEPAKEEGKVDEEIKEG